MNFKGLKNWAIHFFCLSSLFSRPSSQHVKLLNTSRVLSLSLFVSYFVVWMLGLVRDRKRLNVCFGIRKKYVEDAVFDWTLRNTAIFFTLCKFHYWIDSIYFGLDAANHFVKPSKISLNTPSALHQTRILPKKNV